MVNKLLTTNSDDKISYKNVDNNDFSIVYYSFYTYNKLMSNILYFNTISEFDAVEIIPGLFLGSISATYDKKTLQDHGITHVISVIAGYQPPFPNDFYYMIVNALDNCNNNISSVFDDTNNFINSCFEDNGKVLVHCMLGRSRSVSIIIAYLIKTFGLNFEKSLQIIKYKRPIACPNTSFSNQLQQYYKDLYF